MGGHGKSGMHSRPVSAVRVSLSIGLHASTDPGHRAGRITRWWRSRARRRIALAAIRAEFESFTVYEARGEWLGDSEPTLVAVAVVPVTEQDAIDRAQDMAARIAHLLGQDAVAVEFTPVRFVLVRAIV